MYQIVKLYFPDQCVGEKDERLLETKSVVIFLPELRRQTMLMVTRLSH